jgi:hypothetical protein
VIASRAICPKPRRPPGRDGRREGDAFSPAYLDAASGSLIVQAIVAGAAGAAVFFKLGWRRITGPFRRRPAAEVGEQDER